MDREKIILRRGARRVFPWRALLLVVALFLALLPVNLIPGHHSAALAGQKSTVKPLSVTGQWGSPLTIGIVAIHAALLYTGNTVFWYSGLTAGSAGSLSVMWNPTTNAITQTNVQQPIDIFCAGVSQLPNGQILAAGGKDDAYPAEDDGIVQAMVFDPPTSQWLQVADMNYPRWYPTNLELPNGNTLVLSGEDNTGSHIVQQMEVYDYKANTWTVLPQSANITGTFNFYPHLVVLPSGKIFMGGMSQQSGTFDPAKNTWTMGANFNIGQRVYSATVLLPGLKKVLVAGGRQASDPATMLVTNTVEQIDTSQTNPTWSYVAPMNYVRENLNLILMPDGTALAIGGGSGGGSYGNPVFQAESYNPTTNVWTVLPAQQVQRAYHSTAVLLPDGRVVSAGSDNPTVGIGDLSKTLEVYSPPYLYRGTRPTITSAPRTLTYGQRFTITTPNSSSIVRVALIKAGTVTHATHFDERFVDLTFTRGTGKITATAPPSGNYAPPGYYMIDILNSSGVPAVMPFVQLQ
jgi:WD40 repeat protein